MAPKAAAAPPLAGIRYEKCTTEELKAFIRGRKIQIAVEDPVTKRYLIRRLKCNDREATFRFLDLPGELRNWVYEELLTFPASAPKCYPQILATCSQLNKEAKKILFHENQPEIRLIKVCTSTEPVFSYRDDIFVKCGAFEEAVAIGHYADGLIKDVERRWPAYIHKFAHVSIDLCITVKNPPSPLIDLSMTANAGSFLDITASEHPISARSLFHLVSFLQKSPSLKRVTLTGNISLQPFNSSPRVIHHLLHPLARAVANFDCNILGFAELPQFPDHLRDLAKTHAPLYHKNLGTMLSVATYSLYKQADLYRRLDIVRSKLDKGDTSSESGVNAYVHMVKVYIRTPGLRSMGREFGNVYSIGGEMELHRTAVDLGQQCDLIYEAVESLLPRVAAAGLAREVEAFRDARRRRLKAMPAS